MRYGFTTGSCAAAAAKAAAYMLLTGKEKQTIEIMTPKGIPYAAEICDRKRMENQVSCAVIKDGGDDPDVTTGYPVYATVTLQEEKEQEAASKKPDSSDAKITIDGGEGVGRVTRPGLDQPVGNAAINHVPREMIEKEVLEVCRLADYRGNLLVEISVPGGVELAEKTFNPRLGITGGISILGTTGIVEPMSSQAILDTIQVEFRQKKAEGRTIAAVSPGNYGLDFMKERYNYDLDKSVKCSNFIGQTIDMAKELEFDSILLTGHIGKLVKVAGGIMNTHSKEGDCRMELMAATALKQQVSREGVLKILDCVSTEEALAILTAEGKVEAVMDGLMEKIMFYLKKRASDKIKIECIMYSKEYGELAKSKGAKALLEAVLQEG